GVRTLAARFVKSAIHAGVRRIFSRLRHPDETGRNPDARDRSRCSIVAPKADRGPLRKGIPDRWSGRGGRPDFPWRRGLLPALNTSATLPESQPYMGAQPNTGLARCARQL